VVLALLAFLGGALTIVSPCILPVLPFVFAKTEQPFAKSTLPLLVGMALTFAGIATLAAVGGSWAVRINSYGRVFALVLLAAFGVALLSRHVADWISRPFVAFGNRMLERTGGTGSASVAQSFALGIATGFLWAPCAGPILGLILTGAAINGANTQTTLLLFAYALGAIASLAIATLAGTRLFAVLKRSLGAGEWVRRGLGIAVLVAVVAIGLGWDTGVLTRLSFNSTNRIEQSLIDSLPAPGDASGANAGPAMQGGAMTGSMTGSMSGGMTGSMAMSGPGASHDLPVEGQLPSLAGATLWLNSPALTPESLRGKVVLVDFWTYSCINCLRSLPYIRAWYDLYKDKGLVVIGVHAPEFAFEKSEANVRRALKDFDVRYPVALDNDYAIWKAFNNRYWPAHYFIDAQGQIRGHHFGEGNYDESERLIRKLLKEAGAQDLPAMTPENMGAKGIEAAADDANVQSPETYVGYERAENFASTGGFVKDTAAAYSAPAKLTLNQWALSGKWTVTAERAALDQAGGKIEFLFRARDLHLVLGPGESKAVRFKVMIDGHEPGADHGADTDEHGSGTVNEQRLYQLIRQSHDVQSHTFSIEFLDSGAHAYSFTFG
jgi:cytochrome c biogenesis protein CcdA/thiol-disulfide isomerase/thioredoxin